MVAGHERWLNDDRSRQNPSRFDVWRSVAASFARSQLAPVITFEHLAAASVYVFHAKHIQRWIGKLPPRARRFVATFLRAARIDSGSAICPPCHDLAAVPMEDKVLAIVNRTLPIEHSDGVAAWHGGYIACQKLFVELARVERFEAILAHSRRSLSSQAVLSRVSMQNGWLQAAGAYCRASGGVQSAGVSCAITLLSSSWIGLELVRELFAAGHDPRAIVMQLIKVGAEATSANRSKDVWADLQDVARSLAKPYLSNQFLEADWRIIDRLEKDPSSGFIDTLKRAKFPLKLFWSVADELDPANAESQETLAEKLKRDLTMLGIDPDLLFGPTDSP